MREHGHDNVHKYYSGSINFRFTSRVVTKYAKERLLDVQGKWAAVQLLHKLVTHCGPNSDSCHHLEVLSGEHERNEGFCKRYGSTRVLVILKMQQNIDGKCVYISKVIKKFSMHFKGV